VKFISRHHTWNRFLRTTLVKYLFMITLTALFAVCGDEADMAADNNAADNNAADNNAADNNAAENNGEEPNVPAVKTALEKDARWWVQSDRLYVTPAATNTDGDVYFGA
jgi:hypothetical protein